MQTDPAQPEETGSGYYRPSGRFGPVGLLVLIVVSVVASGVGAVAYGFIAVFFEKIEAWGFLGVFAAILASMGVALGIHLGGKLGKVRNTPVLGVWTVVCAVGCLYVGWVIWLQMMKGLVILSPIEILRYIGAGVAADKLDLVWILLEAAIILIGSVATVVTLGRLPPYCERCECWTIGHKRRRVRLAGGTVGIEQRIAAGDPDALTMEPVDPVVRTPGPMVDLHTCPRCDELNVMTIETPKGGSDDTQKLVDRILITADVRDWILEQPTS